MKKNYIRLKSYSTVGDSSWIEIFERGYERQVSAEGNTYEEKILSLAQVHYLLNYEDIKKEDHIPAWLGELNSERLTIISLSQRLIELHKALIYLRERYDLKFEISIYLNSVMPVLKTINEFIEIKSEDDEIVVNSKFSSRLINSSLGKSIEAIKVKPPIPELCLSESPKYKTYKLKDKEEINLGIFSRIIPGKLTHIVIDMMTLLDEKYKLNIYGFEQQPTEYQHDLMNMIRNLNLEKRVRCKKKVNDYDSRKKAFLENDICINLSATFEETLGKTILEACYWGRTVIANEWSGFLDILPDNQIVSTYWNAQEWYYARAIDLSEKIMEIKEINEQHNKNIYLKFFESVNRNQNRIEGKDVKESVVGKNKHSMSITKLKDKTEIRESIEKLFAPNLRKETNLGSTDTHHPWTIYAMNESNDVIIEKVQNWKLYNKMSIHKSEANNIISMLKQHKSNEK